MFRSLLILALLLASPVSAQDFQAGWEAIKRQDPQGALDNWEPLAKQGDTKALYALGWMYHTGRGPWHDLAKARRYYERAAALRHPDACYVLGRMFEQGQGVPRDVEKAIRYYKFAVEFGKGHKNAEFALGEIYFHGRGMPRNFGEATDWYKQAARHNHPVAQFILGTVYQEGWGQPADLALAYYWFSLAARHPPEAITAVLGADKSAKVSLDQVRANILDFDLERAKKMLKGR